MTENIKDFTEYYADKIGVNTDVSGDSESDFNYLNSDEFYNK
jgi:hypothetical protein